MSFKCISINEAKVLIDTEDATVVDVRDAVSFTESNIPGSVHVSGDTVESFLSNVDKNKPLIVYCYHGNTSKGAADYFFSKGFSSVFSMDGGFEEWRLKY